MARPFWSGQLQISLVSFGIDLVPATEAKSEIRFHQIDRRTGERVRHQKVSSEGDEPVEKGDIVKGYEYSKGQFIHLDPAEVEELRIASRHTIDIRQFVGAGEIDPTYYEKPYFVLPESKSQPQAFAVVRKALQQEGKIGLGKLALGGRERVVAIAAPDGIPGMMAYTLRFAAELRNPAEYFSGLELGAVDHEQLSLAKELIQRRTAKFVPDKFADEYETALRELIEAKLKHVKLPQEEKPIRRGEVMNLMDALRRSVNEPGTGKKGVRRADVQERTAGRGPRLVEKNARGSDRRRKSA